MGSKLVFLLCGPMLAALMLAAEGHHDSPQQLLYSDVLEVLWEMAAPYADIKALRNVQINQQVDNIISQIQSITPALVTLHQLVHNVSSNVPLLTTNIHDPLLRVKDTFNQVIGHLDICFRTPNIRQDTTKIQQETSTVRHQTPSTPGSSESSSSSSSEEVQEHHESPLESMEHDQHALRVAADDFRSHSLDGLAPVTSEDFRLDAILNRYDTNSVVSLNDTARAFQAMASRFGQYQQRRFVNLMSKIREVKEKVNNFNQHVTHTTAELTAMNDNAAMFYSKSLANVDELTKLAIAVRDFIGRICQ